MSLSDYIKFAWLDSNKGVRAGIGGFLVCAIALMIKLFYETGQLSAWVFVIFMLVFYYLLFFFANRYFAKKSFNAQQLKTINQIGYVCWLIFAVLAFLVTLCF